MEMNKEKRVGNYGHKKAGRKPILDKKVPIQVYVRASELDIIGGKETARVIALRAILNEIKKQTKK